MSHRSSVRPLSVALLVAAPFALFAAVPLLGLGATILAVLLAAVGLTALFRPSAALGRVPAWLAATPVRTNATLAAVPKAADRLRIMTYGDSNTDGPDRGGWTTLLAPALERFGVVDVEVINAGVAGYSSHQGLARFRRQAVRFEPDIVLVSFGWNDVATVHGEPDHAYALPAAWRVALTRVALHYQSFLVARHWLLDRHPPAETETHRVPLTRYTANLAAFAEVARNRGAVPVLLTRPHRLPSATLTAAKQNWRRLVPRYNRALLDSPPAKASR